MWRIMKLVKFFETYCLNIIYVVVNLLDIANPKSNKRNAGFTQEERDNFSKILKSGFIDSFRSKYPQTKGAYTFWTYMANARKKNVGW